MHTNRHGGSTVIVEKAIYLPVKQQSRTRAKRRLSATSDAANLSKEGGRRRIQIHKDEGMSRLHLGNRKVLIPAGVRAVGVEGKTQ